MHTIVPLSAPLQTAVTIDKFVEPLYHKQNLLPQGYVGYMECNIRQWKLSDAPALAHALSNKNILDNLRDGLPYPYTENDATDYINVMLSANKSDTFAFAIECDGIAVGSIGIFRKTNIHFRTAKLGYYLAEEYWNRGVMTKAVSQACDYVFENSDIVRIFAEPLAFNTGALSRTRKGRFRF